MQNSSDLTAGATSPIPAILAYEAATAEQDAAWFAWQSAERDGYTTGSRCVVLRALFAAACERNRDAVTAAAERLRAVAA